MKITWLGQAGLLFEQDGFQVMVDPYLSDSCEKLNPKSFRRMPIDAQYLKLRPDVMVLTHNHLDHTDPDTLDHFLKEDGNMVVLAPAEAWTTVRQYGGSHNYVMFNRLTEFTVGDVRFRAVRAEHSDRSAVGVLMEWDGKTYYVTGDTLYNEEIFQDLPHDIDVVFLPINGVGNNMNMEDASRFAARVGAKHTVPLHWGMFDQLDPRNFACSNAVIPSIYQEILVTE